MGTPALAVATLDALVEAGHTVESVITQPDRPVGRGKKLTAPAVKVRAVELGLPVFQPERVKRPEAREHLERIQPEVIVVVAYGQIIPRAIIDLPRLGCVNVHVSLLPKYRGAAPINWAIANGETLSGVTTMFINEQLDTGDILLRREVPIGPAATAPEWSDTLAPLGAELLIETLRGLEDESITPTKQDDARASYAPMLKRGDGWIRWNLPAVHIFNRMRGFDPWPGTYTSFRGKRLHIRRGHPEPGFGLAPGAISVAGGRLRVGCGQASALGVEQVQLEGKPRVAAEDFLRGYRPAEGELLGEDRP